jgi:hypothetical protein
MQWSLIIGAGVMIFPLLMHALVGPYIRPVADDFCWIPRLDDGFLNAMEFWYTEWTGRYLVILVGNLIASLPLLALQLLPGLILLLWVILSVIGLYQMAAMLGTESPLAAAIVLALALIFATTEIAPNLEQALYWDTASSSYTMPIVLATGYVAIALYALRYRVAPRRAWMLALLGAPILMLAGGGSESHVSFNITLLIVLLAVTLRFVHGPRRHIALIFLGVAVLVTTLTLFSYLFAPGTAARRGLEAHDLSLMDVTIRSFGYTVYTNGIQINPEHPRRIIALGFLFFAAFGLASARGKRLEIPTRTLLMLLGASGVVTFVLMWSTIFAGYYGLGKALPERARFHTLFILMVMVMVWGYAAGCWLKGRSDRVEKLALMALLVLTLLGPLRSGYNTIQRFDDFRAHAAAWDARDASIRAQREAGIRDVEVQPLAVSARDVYRLGTLVDDPSYWINICVADAYDIDSIRDPQTIDPDRFEDES